MNILADILICAWFIITLVAFIIEFNDKVRCILMNQYIDDIFSYYKFLLGKNE